MSGLNTGTMMTLLMLTPGVMVLAGCGAESMNAAATAAAVKKQEVEQGQKKMDNAQQGIQQAIDASKQASDRADAADK